MTVVSVAKLPPFYFHSPASGGLIACEEDLAACAMALLELDNKEGIAPLTLPAASRTEELALLAHHASPPLEGAEGDHADPAGSEQPASPTRGDSSPHASLAALESQESATLMMNRGWELSAECIVPGASMCLMARKAEQCR